MKIIPKINPQNMYKYLTPAVFAGVCSYETYNDYKIAPKKEKKKVLVRNLTVLTSSLAGILAGRKILTSLMKHHGETYTAKVIGKASETVGRYTEKIKLPETPVVKHLQKGAEKTTEVVKTGLISFEEAARETAEEFLITLGGIATALSSNYLIEKTNLSPDLPESSHHTAEQKIAIKDRRINNYLSLVTDYDYRHNADSSAEVASKVFNAMGVPGVSSVDGPIGAIAGLAVSRQKTTENKFKLTSYELIAKAVIPTFIFAATARALHKAPTAVKVISYPVAGFVGLIAGHHAGKWFEGNVSQKVFDKFSQINQMRNQKKSSS